VITTRQPSHLLTSAASTKPAARRRVSRPAHAGPVKPGALRGSSSVQPPWVIFSAPREVDQPTLLRSACTITQRAGGQVDACSQNGCPFKHQQHSNGGAATRQRLERDEVPTSRRLGRRQLGSIDRLPGRVSRGTVCHTWNLVRLNAHCLVERLRSALTALAQERQRSTAPGRPGASAQHRAGSPRSVSGSTAPGPVRMLSGSPRQALSDLTILSDPASI
jgi:hypothetical protein